MPTLQISPRNIPHDIQYFLDCSIECFDIPPDVYLWARLFSTNITELIDNLGKMDFGDPYHSSTLHRWGEEIERVYLEWQSNAPLEEVQLCLAYGLQYGTNVDQRIRELANTLVEHSTGIIGTIGYYRDHIRHRTPDDITYYDGVKLVERKLSHFQSLYRINKQWHAMPEKPDFSTWTIEYPPRPSPAELREQLGITRKPVDKKVKKALKRSAALLDSVTHEPTTKLFLSGDEVSVTGQKYRFSLTKDPYASLTNGSHGSCRTRVYDATTNEFIAGLCVYTPNVTVFDHLASIVLHCKSGLEDVIINEANITERGNIDLLPEEKRLSLQPKELNLSDEEESPVGLFGQSVVRISSKMKARIDRLNLIQQDKTVQRVMRKYPFLYEIKPVQLDSLQRLLPRYM